jgi:threonine/homoserine/homoserine lactone efflux protein
LRHSAFSFSLNLKRIFARTKRVLGFNSFDLFLAAALLVAVTPGPGIFYIAARTLAGGRREGWASSFGAGLGGLVHVIAGAVGISALVMASAEAFAALKIVGAAYLIWLGLKTFRQATVALPTNFDSAGSGRAFRDGIFVEALNPKTAAFFLAFIPQFIDASQNVATQFVILGMISVALNTTADFVVVYAVARARLGFASRPKLTKRARQGSGVIMCGLGASLLFARRSP